MSQCPIVPFVLNRYVKTMPPSDDDDTPLAKPRWWSRPFWRRHMTQTAAQTKPSQSRLAFVGMLVLGLLMAWFSGWAVVVINQSMVAPAFGSQAALTQGLQGVPGSQSVKVISSAWFTAGDESVFPSLSAAQVVALPDEWARTRPSETRSGWYRIHFETPPKLGVNQLLGAYVDRACAQVEIYLNGQLLYRAGEKKKSLSRQCYQAHVVPLPRFLLRNDENQLDYKVSGYSLEQVVARQRATAFGQVRIGDWETLRQREAKQHFWAVTVSQVIGGTLAILGVFAVVLAWVRRLDYLRNFGGLTVTWALVTGRHVMDISVLPNAVAETMIASAFALMAYFATRFLLDYAEAPSRHPKWRILYRWINALLLLQIVAMPLSLWWFHELLFTVSRVWFGLFAVEVLAAVACFLWFTGRLQRVEFFFTCATLGAVMALIGVEVGFQYGVVANWGWNATYFLMPILFVAVAFRVIQVYSGALQTAEQARMQLEKRVQEISTEIERNFNQIAQLRVEQIAEKERKRIAADLHDDLGAKLLTIVHTSDNDRISGLAREALDEMRLSVRGLTGRPMRLPDALADWRAEMVSRLGQAGIEAAWQHQREEIDMPLSARVFVQTTRIIREAISNIIKHSRATHVIIESDVTPQSFTISIQDNGVGIASSMEGRLDRGHGMTSMKHRAKQLHGQCLIESSTGFGTVIRLSLPLEGEETAPAHPPFAPR